LPEPLRNSTATQINKMSINIILLFVLLFVNTVNSITSSPVLCPRPPICSGCASVEFTATLDVAIDTENVFQGVFQKGQIVEGYWVLNYSIPVTPANDVSFLYSGEAGSGIFAVVHAAKDYILQTIPTESQFKFYVEVDNNDVDISTETSHDSFFMDSYSNNNVTGLPGASIFAISIAFFDSTATALSSAAIPVGAPTITDWTYTGFSFSDNIHAAVVNGTITSVQATPPNVCGDAASESKSGAVSHSFTVAIGIQMLLLVVLVQSLL